MPQDYTKRKKEFEEKLTKHLQGRTISQVRFLTSAEAKHFGWHETGIVLFLDDGNHIISSIDPEGNGPGSIFTSYDEIPTVGTFPLNP